MDIKMGTPRHELAPLINAGVVVAYSGNWPTYEVLSRRLEWSLAHFTPFYEPYSCDELFLDLAHIPAQTAEAYARIIKQTVAKWTGLPLSLGIGPTKTIAKCAIERAKKTDGICVLINQTDIDTFLDTFPVQDVWGIGDKKAQFLKHHHMLTAKAFRDAPPWWVRQHMSVVSARTQLELRGIQAFPIIQERATKHEIMVNRAFGRPVSEFRYLVEALSFYTARACEKLRAEHLNAAKLSVYLATNPFRKNERQYARNISITLPRPTSYTPAIIEAALAGLEQIYQPYPFHRVGIALRALTLQTPEQGAIFAPHYLSAQEKRLMQAMDAICQKFGREAIRFLGSGMQRPWASKQDHRSHRALTQWKELPIVYVR